MRISTQRSKFFILSCVLGGSVFATTAMSQGISDVSLPALEFPSDRVASAEANQTCTFWRCDQTETVTRSSTTVLPAATDE